MAKASSFPTFVESTHKIFDVIETAKDRHQQNQFVLLKIFGKEFKINVPAKYNGLLQAHKIEIKHLQTLCNFCIAFQTESIFNFVEDFVTLYKATEQNLYKHCKEFYGYNREIDPSHSDFLKGNREELLSYLDYQITYILGTKEEYIKYIDIY